MLWPRPIGTWLEQDSGEWNDSIMKLHPGNAQWIGRRAEQQDAFGFAGFDQAYFLAHAGVLAVLADGMGGMSNGREASRSAVQCMLASYREKRPDESIPDVLMRGLTAADALIAAVNAKAMQTQDNATAVVLACQAEKGVRSPGRDPKDSFGGAGQAAENRGREPH
jgi:serine/threonine protein phosphatase PrpC